MSAGRQCTPQADLKVRGPEAGSADRGPAPQPLAIGIGCRRGCEADRIVALIGRALASLPPNGVRQVATLFTIEHKRGEKGIDEAAARLGVALVHLPEEALRAAMPRVATRSQAAERRFGIPSVAEAAALAGAGAKSVLLVRRIVGEGATCAVAAEIPS